MSAVAVICIYEEGGASNAGEADLLSSVHVRPCIFYLVQCWHLLQPEDVAVSSFIHSPALCVCTGALCLISDCDVSSLSG